MVNQVELHPLFVPHETVAYCRARGIAVQAYSPLAGGPNSNAARASPVGLNGTRLLLEHPAVVALATQLGRSPAQVVLRWGIQSGFAVVPRSSNADRIEENVRLFDFSLAPGHMAALGGLCLEAVAQKFCWNPASVR